MLIELPLSSRDLDEAWLTTIDDANVWALLDFDEGEVKRVEFFDSREEILRKIDYAIVAKQGEPIWPMIEDNIFVLVAREGASFDEVIEGFKFKELHEASY